MHLPPWYYFTDWQRTIMLPSIICLLMDFFGERCGCLDSYAANIINGWAGKGNSKKDFEMKGNNPVTDIYFIIVACGEMLFRAIGGLLAAIPQMVVSLWGGLNNIFIPSRQSSQFTTNMPPQNNHNQGLALQCSFWVFTSTSLTV